MNSLYFSVAVGKTTKGLLIIFSMPKGQGGGHAVLTLQVEEKIWTAIKSAEATCGGNMATTPLVLRD